MIHAEAIRKRKNHVPPATCMGRLKHLTRRRRWHLDASAPADEDLFQCADCGDFLGVIGDTVHWAIPIDQYLGI
jgi:5-methylcytosine-specific restriction endonuclease McrA